MNALKIGWSSRDVSTNKPVNIPGQFAMRISRGIMDPVSVTALVIDNGEDMVAFLSADLVVFRSNLLDEIRAKVKQCQPDFPVEKIIASATHTHTAPGHWTDKAAGKETGSSTPQLNCVPHDGVEIASSDEYRDFLSSQAAEAICEAYARRTPGGIAFGYGYAVVAHSRRVVYFDDISQRGGSNNGFMVDGHAKMYGNTRDDNFSHYEAGADHFVNLLYTFDQQNKLTGAIVNVPCPSQCSESRYQISADYWHDTREAIRREHGNIFILPQCAAAGDLSPRLLHYKEAQDRRFRLKYDSQTPGQTIDKDLGERKDIAERLAAAFSEVLSWAKNDIQTALPLKHVVTTIELEKRLITPAEYQFACERLEALQKEQFTTEGTPLERLNVNSRLVSQRGRFERIITRYKTQQQSPTLPMEMHVLRLGEVAFATNRFEYYMDFMHRIQARSPFLQTFVVQLTAVPGMDGGTYLATERAVEGQGYSACLFCNLVSPKGGQQIVDETVRILKELHGGGN